MRWPLGLYMRLRASPSYRHRQIERFSLARLRCGQRYALRMRFLAIPVPRLALDLQARSGFVNWTRTVSQLADILTKALPRDREAFVRLRGRILSEQNQDVEAHAADVRLYLSRLLRRADSRSQSSASTQSCHSC